MLGATGLHRTAFFRSADPARLHRWALGDIAASITCTLEDVDGPLLGIIRAGPLAAPRRAGIGALETAALADA